MKSVVDGEPFPMLRPQDLPGTPEELAALAVGAEAGLARAIAHAPGDRADQAIFTSLMGALGDLVALPGPAPTSLTPITGDPEESAGNHANDTAFGIVRVRADTGRVFAYSALRGYAVLLSERLESGTDVTAVEWGRLHGGFRTLLGLASGQLPGSDGTIPVPGPPQEPPLRRELIGRDAPMRRWLHGHHVFLVFVQGMVVAIKCFGALTDRGRLAEAGRALETATNLMWASAAALRFTGDFPYTDYERRIRPTLMPPSAPPDMSGLRWRDHEYLLRTLGSVRWIFADLPAELEPQRRAFMTALHDTYDAHIGVCAHFVGTDDTSVLMNNRSENPAVATLSKFKRSRASLVAPRQGTPGKAVPQ